MSRPTRVFDPLKYIDDGIGFDFNYNQIKTKYIRSSYKKRIIIDGTSNIHIEYKFRTNFNQEYCLSFFLLNNRLNDYESLLYFDFETAYLQLNLLTIWNSDINKINNNFANDLIGMVFRIICDFSEEYTKINSFTLSDYISKTKLNIFKYIFEHKYQTKFLKSTTEHGYINKYNKIKYSKI